MNSTKERFRLQSSAATEDERDRGQPHLGGACCKQGCEMRLEWWGVGVHAVLEKVSRGGCTQEQAGE